MTTRCSQCGELFDSKEGGSQCPQCGDVYCPVCERTYFQDHDDEEGVCNACKQEMTS